MLFPVPTPGGAYATRSDPPSRLGPDDARPAPTLDLAFELGNRDWKLGFTTGFGQPPRERTIAARDLVPARRVERRDDGITYYNTTRRVDEPFIATVSSDTAWVVASFSRSTGNVWTNPALTCQHVDPQTTLAPGPAAVTEIKLLVVHGSLRSAFQRVLRQRDSLHALRDSPRTRWSCRRTSHLHTRGASGPRAAVSAPLPHDGPRRRPFVPADLDR